VSELASDLISGASTELSGAAPEVVAEPSTSRSYPGRPPPERSEEITKPVTTAARRRMIEASERPKEPGAPSSSGRGRIALAVLVAVALIGGALLAWSTGGSSPIPPAPAASAALPDREPVLLEGEMPVADPATTFVPTIDLRILVRADGTVGQVEVTRPRADLRALEERAVASVRGWRFEPGVRGGRAVERWIRWPLELQAAPSVESLGGFVRIRGSDTLGATLLPDLARSFRAEHRGVRFDIEALGSSTGFVGLFDGSADIAASSRVIRADEREEAQRLGIVVHEILLGWDGIAVIVHPDSPVRELSLAQLRDIYRGQPPPELPRPLHVVTRPPESGTHAFFAERVLGDERPAPDVITIEHGADIVRFVAGDANALGYVGVGSLSPDVRVVRIADGDVAVAPDRASIEEARYPLSRPLMLYVRDRPSAAAIAFLRHVLSAAGRGLVEEHGFVPVTRAPASLDALVPGTDADRPAPLRLLFAPGARELDAAARGALEEWVRELGPASRVVIRGHAGEGEAEPDAVSAARAAAVVAELRAAGVDPARTEVRARGARQPIGPLGSEARERVGRRVDLWEVR
jgi:phosphate binding protein